MNTDAKDIRYFGDADNRDRLLQRYEADDLFRGLVDEFSTGWTDDDGVSHSGPTIGDAAYVEGLLKRLDRLGYDLVYRGVTNGESN